MAAMYLLLYKNLIDYMFTIVEFKLSMNSKIADAIMRYTNTNSIKVFLLPLFVLTVFSASLNLSNSSKNQSSILNLTTELKIPPGVPVDPRFSAEIAYFDDIPLDRESLLGTATATMGKLAETDFQGRTGNVHSPLMRSSSVSIQFQVTTPARQVETRIAIWALYGAVLNIASTSMYQQATMTVYWNLYEVAILYIRPRASSRLTLEPPSDSLRSVSDKLPYLQYPTNTSAAWTDDHSGDANTTNTLSYGDFRTICGYPLDAEVLSVSEVLAAVMTGLKNVASVPKNDRMDGAFASHYAGIDARVVFSGSLTDPNHPTYQYKYVIYVLVLMTQRLLRDGTLAELGCHILVNGQDVGIGRLEKLSRSD